MKTLAANYSSSWRAVVLVVVGRARAMAGDARGAAEAFAQAREQGLGATEREGWFANARNACLAHVARAMAESGQAKEAAAWAAEQTDPLLKAQALLSVAEGLALREEAEGPGRK
jgi:hypothetical protein